MPFSARQGFFKQAGGPWTPAQITTLLWLDASDATTITESGGAVSQWDSKGSQTVSLTQATASLQPIYESANSRVKWDGDDDKLTVASRFGLAANPDLLVGMVAQIWREDGTVDTFGEIGPGNGTTGILSWTAGSQGWSWRHNNGNYRWGNPDLDISHVLSYVRIGGTTYGAGDKFWLDGSVPTVVGTGGTSNSPTNTTANFILFNGTNNNCAPAYLYEMVLVEDSTDETRELVEGYLAWKWGLESNLPVDHPYKDAAP